MECFEFNLRKVVNWSKWNLPSFHHRDSVVIWMMGRKVISFDLGEDRFKLSILARKGWAFGILDFDFS